MYKIRILAGLGGGVVALIATLAVVGCASTDVPTEQASEETPEGASAPEVAKGKASQPQRFEDLEPGETATFQNGLELTLTDAGIVTTPSTPPETDARGNPKPSDPNRVLQNMMPAGTELLAFRFHAENHGPEGVMPARVEGPLTCRDVNGVIIPGVAAHNELRRALRAEAGLGELPRQAAPAAQLSGQPIERGQQREALAVCEMPLAGGEVEVGVELRRQGPPGQEPPGAFWTVDPEELEEFPVDRL